MGLCKFDRLGEAVGIRPLIFLVLAGVLLLPGFYGLIFRFKVNLSVNAGFTPLDAISRREIANQKSFFGANETAEPWYLALFGRPRLPDGNMMNEREFSELEGMYTKVSTNLTFDGPNGTRWTYQNICELFCSINSMLTRAMNMPSLFVQSGYPNFQVLAFPVNIGKYIFQRTLDNNGGLKGSKLMVFYFTTFVNDTERMKQLEELDRQVVELVDAHNADPTKKVEIILHGNHPVESEVQRGFTETAPLVAIGLVFGLLGFCLTMALSARVFRQFGCQTFLWTFVGIFIVFLALPAAFGLLCLIGMPINTAIVLTPFIGIAFLLNAGIVYQIVDIWYRLTHGIHKNTENVLLGAAEFGKNTHIVPNGNTVLTIPHKNSLIMRATRNEKMGYLFEQISRSFLTNLLVSVGSFALTSYFALPNYRGALMFFALVVLYQSALQLFLLCPIIALTCQSSPVKETKQPVKISLERRVKSFFSSNVINPYARFLQSALGKIIFVAIFFIGFLYPASYGVRHLDNEMAFTNILPSDSLSHRGFNFMEQYVWNDFLQFVFIVNRPPDFTNATQYLPFREMVSELESLPDVYGPESDMMWLIDYLRHEFSIDFHKSSIRTINMSKFESFISEEPYNAWRDGVNFRIDENKTVTIDRMLFMVTFKGIDRLSGKVRALTACREILARYPQYDTVSFDTDSSTVDMILSVVPSLLSVALALVVFTAITSVLTMRNLLAAVATTIFTTSHVFGLFGFIYFLDIQLDIFLVGTFFFSSLLGVFHCSHATAEFLRHEGKNRIRLTVERLSCQAIKLTVLLLLLFGPVLFSQVPVHRINVTVVLLSEAIGVLHAVFFIPAALTLCHKSRDSAK